MEENENLLRQSSTNELVILKLKQRDLINKQNEIRTRERQVKIAKARIEIQKNQEIDYRTRNNETESGEK